MRGNRASIALGLAAGVFMASACGAAGIMAPSPTAQPSGGSAVTAAPSASRSLAVVTHAAPLPPGALTIVTLGDSLTEGQGDDSGQGYQGRLGALLEPLRPGTRFVNLGHSGWTSTDLINGQDGQPSELQEALGSQANVALVWIGSNDLWYLYEYGPEPMTAEAEQQDLTTYQANVDRILRELTTHGEAVFIALLDDQALRPVVARPDPAAPAFPNTSAADLLLMSAHVRAYNDIITNEAARYGATAVNFYDTRIFTDAATLYGDGNHPNQAGYDRVAQVWFEALRQQLGPATE
jgi:lysophospholipase L1-like esterase